MTKSICIHALSTLYPPTILWGETIVFSTPVAARKMQLYHWIHRSPDVWSASRPAKNWTYKGVELTSMHFIVINPHLGLFGPSKFWTYIQNWTYNHGTYNRAPVYIEVPWEHRSTMIQKWQYHVYITGESRTLILHSLNVCIGLAQPLSEVESWFWFSRREYPEIPWLRHETYELISIINVIWVNLSSIHM